MFSSLKSTKCFDSRFRFNLLQKASLEIKFSPENAEKVVMHIKSMISVPNPLILGYYLRCSSRFCHALSQLEFTMNFPVDSAFSALWRQKYGIWDDFQVLARSNSVQMPAIGDKITLSMREIQHLEDTENPDTQFCGKYWSDSQWLCTEVMKIIDRWNTWAISPHVLLYPSQLRVEWIPLEIMRCDFMTLTIFFEGGGCRFFHLSDSEIPTFLQLASTVA